MARKYLPLSPTPGARKLMGRLIAGRRPAWLLGILGVFALGMVLAAALLWLPAADPALAQDGAGPEITADPLITSNPESGDAYDKGEAIQVAVTFNEPVTVTGKPRLRLTVGEKRRWAKYDRSEEDGARLIFSYKVKAADSDTDGVSIKKNSIDPNGGTIQDPDGNRARLRHGKVSHQAEHKVNGSPPEPTATPEPEPTATPTPEPTATPQPQEQQPAPANNEPQFAGETAERSVPENSPAGTSVGDPVTATAGDDDILTYALTGSSNFAIDNAGRITVASSATLDYETQASYSVTVSVHDGENAAGESDASVDDTIAVTINVTNVDEAGAVVLDTDAPQMGSQLTATLTDPDGGVTGVAWTWERSADRTTWIAIAGATGAAYTPSGDDAGKYLLATASYADGHGPGKSAQAATASVLVANNEPQFGGDHDVRYVPENSPAGASVGDPMTATDGDGDVLTYALTGSNDFTIDNAGRITLAAGATLDYETQASYSVTVSVHDGWDAAGAADSSVDDTIAVTITVLNVDEAGVVSLVSETGTPQVGSELNAILLDPDGGVTGLTWAWERSADRTAWEVIAGASGDRYTPTGDDAGQYVRATASYADGHGPGKSAQSYADGHGPGKSAQAATASVLVANNEPQFAAETAQRGVPENSAPGASVGDPVTATDGDDDILTYALTGSNDFTIDNAGRITVASGAALDYETQASYSVTVTVHDGENAAGETDSSVDDTIAVTITVLDVDEAGVVSLVAGTEPPEAGSELSAVLLDPDGGVTGLAWAWQRSADGSAWEAIAGASADAYTPSGDDAGHYLRATASYADGNGPGKSAQGTTANAVAVPPAPAEPERQPQSQTTTVWSSTLTVDQADSLYGCSDTGTSPLDNCSEALTDRDFEYGVKDYQVQRISWDTGTNILLLAFSDPDIKAKANLGSLTLHVDSRSFAIADADFLRDSSGVIETRRILRWSVPNLRWTDDQEVALSLEPATDGAGTTSQNVSEDWRYNPRNSGGQPIFGVGQSFRLLFITSNDHKRSGGSANIADYNSVVQGAANANATIQLFKDKFRAVASTASVSAKENTATTWTESDKGVPIYWVGGEKVADDYKDFYDGSWDSCSGKDQSGTDVIGGRVVVWTGSTSGGEKGAVLGSQSPGYARYRISDPVCSYGLLFTTANSNAFRSLYGLSPVLTVMADNVAPTITGVTVTSSPRPGQDGYYKIGDTITVAVTFSEAITVTGVPQLTIKVGAADKTATCEARVSDATNTKLDCAYTVQAGDEDQDGISIERNRLATPTNPAASIKDSAQNDADLSHSRLPAQRGHRVDGLATKVTSIEIISRPSAYDTYRAKERINVLVTFSERNIDLERNSAQGRPLLGLKLNVGGNDVVVPRNPAWSSFRLNSDGYAVMLFTLWVHSSYVDNDGISIPANPLVLKTGATMRGDDGYDVNLDYHEIAADKYHKVNGARDRDQYGVITLHLGIHERDTIYEWNYDNTSGGTYNYNYIEASMSTSDADNDPLRDTKVTLTLSVPADCGCRLSGNTLVIDNSKSNASSHNGTDSNQYARIIALDDGIDNSPRDVVISATAVLSDAGTVSDLNGANASTTGPHSVKITIDDYPK